MKLPEIRIRTSTLLHNNISAPLYELRKDSIKGEMASFEWVQEQAEKYRQAWKPVETKILTGMCQAFNLEFYRPVMDIFLTPYTRSFSTPTIIATRYPPDEFVDILMHELTHVLLTDNKTYGISGPRRLWADFYPEEDQKAKNHILVHAGSKYVYLDVLGEPDRLKRDVEKCQKAPAYKKAWEIVEEVGYQKLIDDFKKRVKEYTAEQNTR